uniref:chitobiase/beta-hexosaminidase C-terminal domain-containing protein n=1 Tax=Agathobacter sp. TaxID=2021311 RepID=UPI004056F75C
MKCIHCGETINENVMKCPKCGNITQIVPDYSIYDDDNIHVLLEGTEQIHQKKNQEQANKLEESEKKAKQAKQKRQYKTTIRLVSCGCIVLLLLGIVLKITMDKSRQNSLEYQLKKGNAAFAKQEYETALGYFSQANKLSPKNCDVLLSLSEIHFKLEQEKEAIDCLWNVVQIDSTNTKAYDALIAYYEKNSDTESILALLETAKDKQVLQLFEDYLVEAPSVNLREGTYDEFIQLTLSSKMGTKIYYTLDGSDPTKKGTLYTDVISIDEMGEFTLKMAAKNKKGIFSEVVSKKYDIQIAPPEAPTVSPGSGIYTVPTYISVHIPNGCSAYYTWDNTTPTENSTLYAAPIPVPEGRNQVLSVIIIDNKTNLTSSVYRGSYDYIPEE